MYTVVNVNVYIYNSRMQEATLNWALLGTPLTVTRGVALVVGAMAAMTRVKSGVRERGVAGPRFTTHVSQGG